MENQIDWSKLLSDWDKKMSDKKISCDKANFEKAMSGLEELESSIDDCIIECATRLVEEQEEAILKTIQHIGGSVFIDITVDKNKVIEALTDYQKKVKGKSDLVEVVRCKDCKHWWLGDRCSYLASYPDEPYMNADDFCSYGERKED